GFFEAQVAYNVEKKEKTASVNYVAKLVTPPYKLRNISYRSTDSLYPGLSEAIKEESFLKTGDVHTLDNLNKELELVEKILRNKGYYFFDSSYLIFKADSTVGERQVDLFLGMEEKIPPQARKAYRLDSVEVINHYTLSKDTTLTSEYDTTLVRDYRYLYRKNDFRPEIIINTINLRKDSLYNRVAQDYTLSRLTDLGTFKFVNIKFFPQRNSNLLKAKVYLTPSLKKSLRFEAKFASKSNNFVGPSVAVSFINRNFLKGAELFQFRVNSGYEVQVSGQTEGKPINSFELGIEASLTFPRFISPIRIAYSSHRYLPRTTVKIATRLQNRVNYFQINSFNLGYGYLWRESEQKNHTFYPIDITYFRRGNISDDFQQALDRDPFLQRSFENQFILGSNYGFTYNSQTGEQKERKQDNFYFNGNIDVSGNLASLVQKIVGKNENTDDPNELFGSPYSQYTRLDVNLRYYHDFNKNSQLATRLIAGTGFAYGNSTVMPYIKQFSSGGSNSLRAFRARSVGPGTYNALADTAVSSFFIDQTGDVKLESTVEYRFGIIGYLKGAVFADAGNIWLLRDDANRPGADFKWDSFLKEIGVGTGAGLRLDASFFVLRLDFAFPLRKPFLPEGDRWVIKNIDFGDKTWRKNNLILNVAIGYPF
ncbi:MAG: BamA/TamA family outer membrane protein, partial [Verrucomicrobia bacterium]|nr:BamA/TamA family outer membrane protein [Cytophagales bacterium]